MDCRASVCCLKENPAACYAVFPEIPYVGEGGGRARAGVPPEGSSREISGICVYRKLLIIESFMKRQVIKK